MNPESVQRPPINFISRTGTDEIPWPATQRPTPIANKTPRAHFFEMNQNAVIIPIKTTMLIAM